MGKREKIHINMFGPHLVEAINRGTLLHRGVRYKIVPGQRFDIIMDKLASYWIEIETLENEGNPPKNL